VTVRMLLTHTSGEPEDVRLNDPWGLDGADKPEGIRRAPHHPAGVAPRMSFSTTPTSTSFCLGALIEKVTGEPEDVTFSNTYLRPLGMEETRYLPPAKACAHM